MKTYFIRPIDFYNYESRFEQQYIDYTKKEALKLYKEKFPHFTTKELCISNRPYFNL